MLNAEKINKSKLYWLFQAGGWTMFYIVFVAILIYFAGFHWQIFFSYGFTALIGFGITHFFRLTIKGKEWYKRSILRLSMSILFSSIGLGILWAFIVIPVSKVFFPLDIDGQSDINWLAEILLTSVNLSITILAWMLIYFVFQLFFSFRKSEVEKLKLDTAVKDAELIALKSQINPHFIFNSLNNIRSLVIENPEKARDMITHLSGLLRYSVQFNAREKVKLEDELEVVQNYLNLESIQFEDRLRYALEIKPETMDMAIPPMAIQLLVENAIKHGISNLPDGGLIRIKSYLENQQLIVEVINTGQLKEKADGTGIGMKNASDRLKLLFGKLSNLTIQNLDQEHVEARFTIPLT